MPRVLTDHHDPAVTADHLAFIADLLDARLDLHGIPLRVAGEYCLFIAVDDAAARQIIGAELHHDPVLGEDPDIVLAHFP